jgi:murein DD-endopeptidase MepM/ murein hydrolase activator NlpD
MWKVLMLVVAIGLLGLSLKGGVKSEGQKGAATSTPVAETAPQTIEKAPEEAKAVEPSLTISPATILQGEPALITINNIGTSTVRSLSFNSKAVGTFSHEGKLSALVGIDLRQTPGSYPLVLTLSDGSTVKKNLVVGARQVVKAPLGIPEELGGNTPEAEKELLNTLVQEGALISAIPTASEKLWSGAFRVPIDPPITITDVYGYSRLTGASTIAHKGTDFRAAVGTPVYTMNSGTVRFTRNLRNYGNVIGVDHGLGLLTIYMHLSEINVALGQEVKKGELIGKSGNTGYVLGPHLHLTVRINGISIDPLKFLELLGE